MATAASLDIRFTSDTRNAEAGMDRLNNKVRGLDGSFKKTLGSVAGGMILGGIVQGIAREVGGFVKGALDFEASMANVNSIAQLTGGEIDSLAAKVIALAGPTAQAPKVLADALYQVYSSGFKGAEALEIVEAAGYAATAGLTSAEVAAAAVTAVMNAYTNMNYDAATASDILFQIVNDGVVTFEQIAVNMGNTLPLANAMGISFEQVGAAYAEMTKQGINASLAETQISALMKAALNPTQALTDATIAYGYSSIDALIAAEGMPGLLKAIDKAQIDGTASLRDLVATDEAANAARILSTDGAKAYITEVDRMKHASDGLGATNKALAKQMESSSFRIKQAKIAVQQAATVFIGAFSPAIQLVAQGFTYLVMNGLIPVVEWISKIVGKGAELIGFFKDVFGSATSITSILDKLFGNNSAMYAGLGPGGLVDSGGGRLKELVRSMLLLADSAGHIIRAFQEGGVSGALEEFGNQWDRIKGEIGDIAHLAIDVVVDIGNFVWATALPDLWGWVKGQLGVTGGTQVGDGTGVMPRDIQEPVTLSDVGVSILSWAWSKPPDLWGWVMDELGVTSGGNSGTAKGMPGGPPQGGSAPVTLEDVGVNILSWFLTATKDIGTAVFDKVTEWWPTVKDSMGNAWDATLEIGTWLIEGGSNLFTAVSDKLDEWWPIVQDSIGDAWEATLSVGTWLIEGGSNLFTAVHDKLNEWWPTVQAGIGDAWEATLTIGSWIVNDANIPGLVAQIAEKIKGVTIHLKDYIIEVDPATESNIVVPENTKQSIAQRIGDAFADALTVAPGTTDKSLEVGREVGRSHIASFFSGVDSAAQAANNEIIVSAQHFGREIMGLFGQGAADGAEGAPKDEARITAIQASIVGEVIGWFDFVRDSSVVQGFGQMGKDFGAFVSERFVPGIIDGLGDMKNTLVQTGAALGAGIIDGLRLVGSDIVRGLGLWVDDLSRRFKDLPGNITNAVGQLELDIPIPKLPSWLDTDWGWITDPIAELTGYIADLLGLKMQAEAATASPLPQSTMGVSEVQRIVGSGQYLDPTQYGPGSVVDVPSAPIPVIYQATYDDTAIPSSLKPLFSAGTPPVIPDTKAVFNLDIQQAGSDMAKAMQWGLDWDSRTFIADFNSDINQTGLAVANVMQMGLDWDSRVFVADFNADISQAGNAVSTAMQWGLDWDGRVFTASFNVDTSALSNAVAVAAQAAADIDALMPHSPAKKGPLSRTPNFSYITDALAAAMANMAPTAERGMGDVADRLGRWSRVSPDLAGGSGALGKWRYADGRSGSSGNSQPVFNLGGLTIHGPIYGVDDLEDKIVDTFTDKVVPAMEIAKRRQDRSWGLSS